MSGYKKLCLSYLMAECGVEKLSLSDVAYCNRSECGKGWDICTMESRGSHRYFIYDENLLGFMWERLEKLSELAGLS